MKKRILAGLLMAAMLCFVLMVTASAADETYYIGASGSGNYYADHAEGWKAAVEASMNNSSSVTVVLSADWEATSGSFGTDTSAFYDGAIYVPSGANIILDLNGYKINRGLTAATATEYGSVIYVEGELTVQDSKTGNSNPSYTISNPNYGIVADETETVTISTGLITGGYVDGGETALSDVYDGIYGGAGIFVYRGTLTLEGGTIAGNSVISHTAGHNGGGGVFVYGDDKGTGTFTMNGGTISYNYVASQSGYTTSGVGGGGVLAATINYNEFTQQLTETAYYAAFTMNDGTIEHNAVNNAWGGGVYSGFAKVNLLSGTISSNAKVGTGGGSGGGVCAGRSTKLTLGSASDTTNEIKITDNTSTGSGGGIFATGNETATTDIIMYSGEISENSAANGGGIYLNNKYVTMIMSSGEMTQNTATGSGGGIYSGGGKLTLLGGTIGGESDTDANSATNNGGGIFSASGSTLTVSGSTISYNEATGGAGGGIYSNSGSTLTMTDGTISNNTANTSGGGIYANISTSTNYGQGSVNISGGTISNNTATNNSGGGVWISGGSTDDPLGTAIFSGTVEISENKAENASNGYGGGIYLNYCNATVSGGVIDDNTAAKQGGGIYALNGTLTITDGTISGNTAPSSGGGIFVSSSTLNMSGGEISGNISDSGGGIKGWGTCIFNLSGNPVITGNTKTDETSANNFYLRDSENETITLTGELTSGANIGVTTAASPISGADKQITTAEDGTSYYETAYKYFVSDAQTNSQIASRKYIVQADESNYYVELAYSTATVYYVTLDMDNGVTSDMASPVQVVEDTGSYPYSITLALNEGYSFASVSGADSTDDNQDGSKTLSATNISENKTITVTTSQLDVADASYTGGAINGTYGSPIEVEIADSVTATYSDSTAATISSYKVTSGKLPAGLTLTSDGTLTGTPIAATDGSVDVTVTVTAANGMTTTVPLSITIAKVTPTLTLSPTSGSVSANVGTTSFTYTYDGDGEVTAESSDESVATVSVDTGSKTVTVTVLKAGTATITVNAGETSTYTAASTDYTLTVTRSGNASLILSATSGSVKSNVGTTTFTYTYEGDGEVTVESSDESVATAAVNTTSKTVTVTVLKVGAATITVNAAETDNYAAASAEYALTVTRYTSGSSSSSSSSSTTRTITVEDYENGSVTSDLSSASSGTTVTLTISPDDGYELDELTVTNVSTGKTISVTQVSDTEYTFTMPAAKVTIEATFVESAGTGTDTVFVDVDEGAYYYDAVLWAVENGITTGTSTTTFSPDLGCTRAQMVTFLWRAAGSPVPSSTSCVFTDLDSSDYYYTAVLWAVENGITNGTTETTFSPDDTVTRSQTVTLLYRYEDTTSTTGTLPYADVSTDAYYYNAVLWANENAITNGTSSTTFSPEDDCTRAQIVTFMYRYMA